MAKHCDYCRAQLDLGREFIYEFESLKFLDDEQQMAIIRQSAMYFGEPLKICNACSDSVARNQQELRDEESTEVRLAKQSRNIFLGGIAALLAFCVVAYLAGIPLK